MFITVAGPGGASRGISGTLEREGQDSVVAILRFLCGSPICVIKDSVTEPPLGGVHRQDQLEQFSVKREHNQHT
jgi:hypothetical protein